MLRYKMHVLVAAILTIWVAALALGCGGSEFEEAPMGFGSGGQAGQAGSGGTGVDGGSAGAAGSSGTGGSIDAGGAGGSVDAGGGDAGGAGGSVDAGGYGGDAPLDAADADAGEAYADAQEDADAEPEAGEDSDSCTPSTCAQLGKDCGPVDDGCGTTLNCGSCASNMSCGGGGVPNVCGGCVPITCDSVPQYCGLLEDGCGNTIDCGPYERGYDPSCASFGSHSHKWYCSPEQVYAPPPFDTGCVSAGTWPGSYCCIQDS